MLKFMGLQWVRHDLGTEHTHTHTHTHNSLEKGEINANVLDSQCLLNETALIVVSDCVFLSTGW